jgi:hypothetical protein
MYYKLLFLNAIKVTFNFPKMSLKSHLILLLHVSALLGHPQATVNRLKPPQYISSYVNILHATIACRRCLRMYAHTSLTLPSHCGVHAVFPLCVTLASRACIPYIAVCPHFTHATFILRRPRCVSFVCSSRQSGMHPWWWHFKINIYVSLETEPSGRVIPSNNIRVRQLLILSLRWI